MKSFIKLEEMYEPKIIELLKKQERYRLRELFANLVAQIYNRVEWWKIASGKNIAPNVFQHRLFFAAKEDNVEVFIERLCSSLSIQSTLVSQELVHEILVQESHMNFLREQTRVFTAYAMKLSKELTRRRKEK